MMIVVPGTVLGVFLLNLASLARWRPPVTDEARVVYVDQVSQGRVLGVTHQAIVALGQLQNVFEMFAFKREDQARNPEAGGTLWTGEMVSGQYFEILGLQSIIGRPLLLSDDAPDADRSMVISERLWRVFFASDRNLVGRRLRLDPASTGIRSEISPSYTIVGVMADNASKVSGPFRVVDYWTPMTARVADYACDIDLLDDSIFTGIGKLAGDVTRTQAQAATEAVWRAVRAKQFANNTVRVSFTPNFRIPFDRTRLGAERLAFLASGLAGVVLVVSLANLAGLLMLRAIRRRSSDATRVVLGGGPWLASRTVLAEGAAIGIAGAVLSVPLLHTAAGALRASFPAVAEASTTSALHPSLFVDLTLATSCLLFGCLAGLLPAYHSRPTKLIDLLHRVPHQVPRLKNQAVVVVPQVALATAVMMVAATVVVSVVRTEVSTPGYAVDQLVFARFGLPTPARCNHTMLSLDQTGRDINRTAGRIYTNLQQWAAGRSALSSSTPFRPAVNWIVARRGNISRQLEVAETAASSSYAEVLGLRVLRGRFFDGTETAGGPPVAVISAMAASQLWDGDPIGQEFGFSQVPSSTDPEWITVIGVVNDSRTPLSEGNVTPWVYTPLTQRPPARFVLVRSPFVDRSVAQGLRESVSRANADVLIPELSRVSSYISSQRYPRRVSAIILGVCGLLTACISCAGLYSLTSYATTRRLTEFGICLALGAQRSQIILLALRDGAKHAVTGIALGIALGSVALTLTSRLVGDIPALSPAAILLMIILMSSLLLMASTGPVRLVSAIDPVQTLRNS
jgi:predicted permease